MLGTSSLKKECALITGTEKRVKERRSDSEKDERKVWDKRTKNRVEKLMPV